MCTLLRRYGSVSVRAVNSFGKHLARGLTFACATVQCPLCAFAFTKRFVFGQSIKALPFTLTHCLQKGSQLTASRHALSIPCSTIEQQTYNTCVHAARYDKRLARMEQQVENQVSWSVASYSAVVRHTGQVLAARRASSRALQPVRGCVSRRLPG